MTLDDIEGWAVTTAGGIVAGLIGWVRKGDLDRIKAIEQKQRDADGHVTNEVRALRTELQSSSREIKTDLEAKHAQVIGLLVNLQR